MNTVIQTMLDRRSCRSYTKEQLKEDDLQQILLAGTYAASGMNMQSAKIVVVQDADTREQLRHMNAAVMGTPDADPFYGAPTVVAVLADTESYNWLQDGSLVMGNLMNAAASIGVGSCWINRARETFDRKDCKDLLAKWGLGDSYRGVGYCILGYADCDAPTPKERKENYIIKV